MTRAQKILIQQLVRGCFLRKSVRLGGAPCYRLYDSTVSPVAVIRAKTVESLDRFLDRKTHPLWKTSKDGRITLNLNTVRKLHGGTILKSSYKEKDQPVMATNIYKSKRKQVKRDSDEKSNSLF